MKGSDLESVFLHNLRGVFLIESVPLGAVLVIIITIAWMFLAVQHVRDMELRRNTGKEKRRCHYHHHAVDRPWGTIPVLLRLRFIVRPMRGSAGLSTDGDLSLLMRRTLFPRLLKL